jgi:hypothetical protein
MAEINRAWGILAKGEKITDERYARRFSPFIYKGACKKQIDTLIPREVGRDDMYRSFYIEETIKLVLRSALRDRLLAFEEVQSYTRSALLFPSPGFKYNSVVPIQLYNDGGIDISRLRISADVTGGDTLTYTPYSDNKGLTSEVQAITFTNGQSNKLYIVDNKLWFRLRSGIPSSFSIGMEIINTMTVNWETIFNNVKKTEYTFKDKYLESIYRDEPNWVDQLAAYIMDILETCK